MGEGDGQFFFTLSLIVPINVLQPEHLLNTSDNVTVQCHTPRVIIQTVATEDIASSVSQAELTVDSDLHSSDFPEPPDALEADTFPDEIPRPKMTIQPPFNNAHVSKYSDQNSTELMNSVMVRTEEEIADTDLKQEPPSDLASAYVTEVSCVEDCSLFCLGSHGFFKGEILCSTVILNLPKAKTL